MHKIGIHVKKLTFLALLGVRGELFAVGLVEPTRVRSDSLSLPKEAV